MVIQGNGEYELIIGDEDYLVTIKIEFTINLDGIVSYNEPEFFETN